jgi:hypothetical protein
MIKELKLIKRKKLLGAVIICAVLIASLTMLWQMSQVAEAAILTPYNFYDDFSRDLSQWTLMGGTWVIESEELSQSDSDAWEAFSVAGSGELGNYIIEAKAKLVSGLESSGGVVMRFTDASNYYTFYIDPYSAVFAKRVDGTWYGLTWVLGTHDLNVWYQLKVNASQNTFKCYVDSILVIEITDTTFLEGRIGLRTKQCQARFDDVKVSDASGVEVSSTYGMNVRAGVTQVIVTCTWTGSGNITIELASPTTTYYESDMSIYEKSKVSISGTTATTLNIKRAALHISATSTSEPWTLYLDLNDVAAYEVSVETT